MITKEEILNKASTSNLSPMMVEKDYVLGWILAGISNHAALSREWVFKGGTCLKKCYFPEYRYSEDLDFTIRGDASTDPNFIHICLSEVRGWLYEYSGIEVPEIIVQPFLGTEGKTLRGKLGYIGPLDQRGSLTRLKLDITQNELMVAASVKTSIFHQYSDGDDFDYNAEAYSYNEIFAEKLRALFDRARPRDLYDVINLFERKDNHSHDKEAIRDIFIKKLAFRGLPAINSDSLISKIQEEELLSDWESMLAHQLGNLGPANDYLAVLPKVVKWVTSD